MRIITPATGLPISVAELAADAHIDEFDEGQLERLIRAATAVVETGANRPILQREVEFDLPEGGWSEFWLPCAPCDALIDAEGAELRSGFDEPRIVRGSYAALTLRARVGYVVAAAAPPQMLQAITLLALEWRDIEISAGEVVAEPRASFGAQRLLKQIRYRRPQVLR